VFGEHVYDDGRWVVYVVVGEVRCIYACWFLGGGVLGATSAFHVWKEGRDRGRYVWDDHWDPRGVC
jgi:hypothetical protein